MFKFVCKVIVCETFILNITVLIQDIKFRCITSFITL